MPVSARHGVTSSIWGRLRILSISVAVSHGEIQCPILEVKKRGPRRRQVASPKPQTPCSAFWGLPSAPGGCVLSQALLAEIPSESLEESHTCWLFSARPLRCDICCSWPCSVSGKQGPLPLRPSFQPMLGKGWGIYSPRSFWSGYGFLRGRAPQERPWLLSRGLPLRLPSILVSKHTAASLPL